MTLSFRRFTCAFALLIATGSSYAADVAVIVHPSATAGTASTAEVANLFLGRAEALPGGTPLRPVDQSDSSSAKAAFYKAAASRSLPQLSAYWGRLKFTGRGTPPPVLEGDAAVKAHVARTPGAIGYVSVSAVDSSVKVVLTL